MDSDKKKPGNYLAFDGGLSGLPGLYTLEELFSRLQFDLESDVELHPWRHFKVIIGSGPGGLNAIFIGRMKMTVSEAIEAYTKLLLALSVSPAKDEGDRRANTERFRSAFLEIIKETGFDEKSLFLDEKAPKTIICTLNTTNPSIAYLIRSYRSRSVQASACTILEAACACVASSDTFLPIQIGTGHKQVMLVDATTGFANPSQELLREAQRIFGGDEEVATLVSIGAGKGDVWSLPDSGGEKERLKALQRIVMNCEPVHEEMLRRLRDTGIYYRLNVERGSGPQMQLSSTHISAYLQEEEISDKLDGAIKNIQRRGDGVRLKDINSVTVIQTQLKPRPSLVRNFVGREDILEAMRRTHFTDPSPELNTPAITVLFGLGGSGKTQISLKFALEFERALLNTPVYFLNAESETSLKNDYENVIRSLGYEHRSKSSDDALVWLATKLKKWLLILDNADNPDLPIFSYIPKSSLGHVVITTRNSNHATLAPNSAHHIGGLSEAESVTLILSSSGYEDTESNEALAVEIVRELGNLPLALAQAAGYLFVNKCLSRYLDIYQESTVKILTSFTSQRAEDYRSPVARTIQMSLDRLPQEAQDLVRLLAHLDPTSIPHIIISKAAERRFEHATRTDTSELNTETMEHAKALRAIFFKDGEWSDFEFNELITQCLQYSLLQIRTRGEDKFYSMHVLVRSYLKASSTLIQSRQPCQLVVRLLGSSLMFGKSYQFLAFNRLLLPHLRLVRLEDVVEAGDYFGFGQVLHETGDRKLALTHQERCVEMWRASVGDEHVNTLRAMTELANSYRVLERSKEALELDEHVLKLRKKLSGPEDLETLEAIYNLARSYRHIGRKTEAMEMEKELLEMQKRILGPENSFTLVTMSNLAKSYSVLGWNQDALELKEQVLEIRSRISGQEHPVTITAMSNLAVSYSYVGRDMEAMKLREQVLGLRTKVLGLEHPETVWAMWNLTISLENLGLKERLLALLQTSVPLYEKVWGLEDEKTIAARKDITTLSLELEGRTT